MGLKSNEWNVLKLETCPSSVGLSSYIIEVLSPPIHVTGHASPYFPVSWVLTIWGCKGWCPGNLPIRKIQDRKTLPVHSKNHHGFCLLSCCDQDIYEDEEHILLSCGSLSSTRQTLSKFTLNYAKAFPHLSDILLTFTNPAHPDFFQFLLDCSAVPQVISLEQLHSKESLYSLFKVTWTWCYSLHRDRLKMLGRWTLH